MTKSEDRQPTRERLLDAAVELLRTKGPAASGTKEILVAADAPRGSFYFHFPDGKDQLVLEALDQAAAATEASMRDALQDRRIDLPRRVEAYLKGIAAELAADDYRLGCAVGVTALEACAVSPPFREATEAAFASWTSALAEQLQQEGIDEDRASALADSVIAAMEGATMLARVRRDPAPLEHAATMLAVTVHAVLSEAQ